MDYNKTQFLSFLSVEPSSSSSDEEEEKSVSISSASETKSSSSSSSKEETTTESSTTSSSSSVAHTILKELLSPPITPPEIKLTLMDDLGAHCVFIPYQRIEDSPLPPHHGEAEEDSCFSLFGRCFVSIFSEIYESIEKFIESSSLTISNLNNRQRRQHRGSSNSFFDDDLSSSSSSSSTGVENRSDVENRNTIFNGCNYYQRRRKNRL